MQVSFSSQVKKEVSAIYPESRHCKLAEMAAFINHLGSIEEERLIFKTENVLVAKKIYQLSKLLYNNQPALTIKKHQTFRKHGFEIAINEADIVKNMLKATEITENRKISSMLIRLNCCKKAYLRGAFLASGSMTDPQKNYHLEFVVDDKAYGEELLLLLHHFKLSAKMVQRKSHFMLYLKEGEQIVDLLNIIGAHVALLELENLRILKSVRNDVNRLVNAETANLKKTVTAAVRQIEDIKYIDRIEGLDKLPPHLEEMAQVRIENPESTLKELGEKLSPSVGKSGVNHRLRRISEWADKLKEENNFM